MKSNLIARLTLIGFAATSCGKITVQVKKDAKNSTLQDASAKPAEATDNFSLANPEDFLKHIDDLRTTAAEIIIKKLASQDYVGKFRSGVRNYRKFLIAHARKQVTLGDSFYSDTTKECRDGGLNLNIDKDNEILGLILETAIIAKIGETNVGKLNSGLTKEMQALSQFITMELGLDIQGTSTADTIDGVDVTSGQVTLKLKPIAGEAVDADTVAADAKQVLTLQFERRLGKDTIGTFHADLSLVDTDNSIVQADFDISRAKETDHYNHIATVTMGLKGQTPNYARQITVSDIPGEAKKFNFTDVLNIGTANESVNKTIVDAEKGSQCKIAADSGTDSKDTSKDGSSGKPTGDSGSTGSGSTGSGSGSSSGGSTGNPTQSPTQTPTQTTTGSQSTK